MDRGDPSTGIKRTKISEVRSWTDDEIRQYENRWPIGTKQRTAFALMLFTGQRRSDVHRMTWQDISQRTGRIKVHQKKTARRYRCRCIGTCSKCWKRRGTITSPSSTPSLASLSQLTAFHPSCAMPSEPQDCRLIVSRMDCARPLVAAWRKPDAPRSRSWRSLATSRLRKRSDTRRKPIKSDLRRRLCRYWKRKPRTNFAQTARSSLGTRRKNQETQCDREPAGAP